MAEIIVMPQLGNSVESVFLLGWKITTGAGCAVGDILCEVETDKATMEVEATAAGTVLALLATEGDEVAVKAPLVVVGDAGEDYSAVLADAGGTNIPSGERSAVDQPSLTAAHPALVSPVSTGGTQTGTAQAAGTNTPAVSPRARVRATKHGVDPAAVVGSGPGGRVIERDVLAALVPGTAAVGSATQGVHGTAIGGRVGSDDLAAQSASRTTSQALPISSIAEHSYEEYPIKGIRKVIAERMLSSLTTTAQLTLNRFADARALERMRGRFKSAGEAHGLSRVNINDMVMYAVAKTLPQFSGLNAHFLGDRTREFTRVDLGFAVDTERGLMVPTLAAAESRTLAQMSSEIKRLAELCQSGKAGPEELAPATFTVTNLGAFGVESFTPVLNPPQVAILGVSAITLQAVRGNDGSVEHLPSIGLSLTIDHQAVDGAPAARFLAAVSDAIASIDLLLAL